MKLTKIVLINCEDTDTNDQLISLYNQITQQFSNVKNAIYLISNTLPTNWDYNIINKNSDEYQLLKKYSFPELAVNEELFSKLQTMSAEQVQTPSLLKKIIPNQVKYAKHFLKFTNKNNIKTELDNLKKPSKVNKVNQFSIIVACYNSELYLDRMFESLLINTTYDINNIEIIMVDDGSTDQTKAVIEQWVQKYPKQVKYFYQVNQGQAIARNFGIENSTKEWVVFIDSDDFVNEKYFASINEGLNIKGAQTVFMQTQNYFEINNEVDDNNELKYRFWGPVKFKRKNLENDPLQFQIFGTAIVFKLELIKEHNLKFDNIKPVFEDCHFILKYLLATNIKEVVMVKDAIYYYVHRAANNSTVDLSKTANSDKYVALLKNGYLDIISKIKEQKPEVPLYLIAPVIFDLKNVHTSFYKNSALLTYEELVIRDNYLQQIYANINEQQFLQLAQYYSNSYKQYIINTYFKTKE